MEGKAQGVAGLEVLAGGVRLALLHQRIPVLGPQKSNTKANMQCLTGSLYECNVDAFPGPQGVHQA